MLIGPGHSVRLIAPEAVMPFVKRGKQNGASDAAAIYEAAGRPEVKFAPVKNMEQQGILALHAAPSLLIRQRVMPGRPDWRLTGKRTFMTASGGRRDEGRT
jgi:transposase